MSDYSKVKEMYRKLQEAGASPNQLAPFADAMQAYSGIPDGGDEYGDLIAETTINDPNTAEANQKTADTIGKMIAKLKEAGATDEMLTPFKQVREQYADRADKTEEIRAAGGVALEGLTGGLVGDEARAGILSMLTGSDYNWQLEQERLIERNFYRDNPALATSILMGTSLLPSSKLGKAVGVGKTAAQGIARVGGLAGAEGAVWGFMEGEGSLENRVAEAVKMGGLGALIGGGIGGLLGRAEGRSIAAAEKTRIAQEIDDLQSKYLRGELVDSAGVKVMPKAEEVLSAFQKQMDDMGLEAMAQTGRPLSGLDYGQALQEAADTLGVPIRKLRHAEAVTGKSIINFDDITMKELRNRAGTLADEVGFNNGSYNPNRFTAWVDDKFRSLSRTAAKQVGPRFGSQVQRVASGMARRHASTENFLQGNPAVMKFADAASADPVIKRLTLNMSNIDVKKPTANLAERKDAYNQLVSHIKTNYGDEALAGFEATRNRLKAQAVLRRQYVDSGMPVDEFYWPSVKLAERVDNYRFAGTPRKTVTSAGRQTRDMMDEKTFNAAEYEDVMVAAQDWMRESDSLIEMFKGMKLENINVERAKRVAAVAKAKASGKGVKQAQKALNKYDKRVLSGAAQFDKVRQAVRLEGADELTGGKAADTMMSLVNMGSRGPSGLISNLRKAAYMGTIANPYSAILNLGDTFNSMVNYGGDNTFDAIVDMMKGRGVKMNVADLGLKQQVTGEFIREGTTGLQRRFNKISQDAFRLSGFTNVDAFGKNVAIKAGLKQGAELARNGKLESEWGHAFTKNEMAALKRDLLSGKESNIVKEFAAAQLAKLQPSDMAQMPKWYLDHPNWRVLYMLRTFGLKQLEQIERLVAAEYKAGNKKEALKNAMAYAVIVGGGNAALNEGRQALKGDEPALENLPMRWADHMLGAASINTIGTYQLSQAAQGRGDAFVASVAPAPMSMVVAPVVDLLSAAGGRFDDMENFLEDSETLGWAPWGRLVQEWAKD